MKIKAIVTHAVTLEDGSKYATMKCNGKLPKVGDTITLSWGRARSLKQNSIYWLLLTFYMEDCGLKDEYLDTQELHEVLKGRFLAKKVTDKHGMNYIKIGSTTDLTCDAFMEYIEKCERAIQEYHGISAAPFWATYAQTYAGG